MLADEALLRQIAAGDVGAFEAFYRRHYVRLMRFVLRTAGRAELVEEVINDTMLVVWNKAASFRGEAQPTSWLLGIAWRKTKSRLRGLNASPQTVELAEADTEDPLRIEEVIEDRQFGEVLRECLSSLSAAHRAVVELTYFEGYSSREVGEILGCPEGTVRTRMLHARHRLRALLVARRAVPWESET